MNDTKQKFQECVKEWKEHCEEMSIYSSFRPYLNCDAHEKIVGMGRDAIPYIRDEYENNEASFFHAFMLPHALQEIAPDFKIPTKHIDGKFYGYRADEIIEYTKKWLSENAGVDNKPDV